MNVLLGNVLYGICAVIAALFALGAVAVLIASLGDSPLIAFAFAAAIALLIFGFGWSGRRLLTGNKGHRFPL